MNCSANDSTTVQPLLVLPSPSTKVCSNIAIKFVPFHVAAHPRTALRAPAVRCGTSFTGVTGAFDPLELRKFCQNTRIGLAMKIDEYVPTIIPTTRANEKLFSTWPPNKNSDMAVKNVRPLVRMVRLSV